MYSTEVGTVLSDFVEWIAANPAWGSIALCIAYIFATVLFVPGLILTLGAGYAFGNAFDSVGWAILLGSISVFVGAWIGSLFAMLLGRYVFREKVAECAQKVRVFKAIDKAIETEGLKITFLLRLCPLIPFNVFNYVMGLTNVKTRDYMLAGFGMLPGTIVYIYIGTNIYNIQALISGDYDGGVAPIILLIVGSVLACGGIIYISIVVRRYLKANLEEEEHPVLNEDVEHRQHDD